jgi:hypothetical protein
MSVKTKKLANSSRTIAVFFRLAESERRTPQAMSWKRVPGLKISGE